MITVTFNIENDIAARLATSYGAMGGLTDDTDPENPIPRDATMGEFKAKIINETLNKMFAWEKQQLVNGLTVPSAEIS